MRKMAKRRKRCLLRDKNENPHSEDIEEYTSNLFLVTLSYIVHLPLMPNTHLLHFLQRWNVLGRKNSF